MALGSLKMLYLSLIVLIICGSLALNITSIIRKEWLRYDVNSGITASASQINPASWCAYSRDRGIFFECLDNSSATILTALASSVRNGQCFAVDLGQNSVLANTNNYWSIILLRRAQLGLLAAGSLTLAVALITLLISFGEACSSPDNYSIFFNSRATAAGSAVVAFLSIFCSHVIFHANLVAEMSRADPGFPCLWANMDSSLQNGTTLTYGVMYILSWCSAGLALLACVMILGSLTWIPPAQSNALFCSKYDEPIYVAYSGNNSEIGTSSTKRLPRIQNIDKQHLNSAFMASNTDLPRAHIPNADGSNASNLYRVY